MSETPSPALPPAVARDRMARAEQRLHAAVDATIAAEQRITVANAEQVRAYWMRDARYWHGSTQTGVAGEIIADTLADCVRRARAANRAARIARLCLHAAPRAGDETGAPGTDPT